MDVSYNKLLFKKHIKSINTKEKYNVFFKNEYDRYVLNILDTFYWI